MASLKPRLHTIDWLRGFIMVIMALDHTRDFLHIATGNFEPTDLTQTNPPLFYTRIITHLCAPTFVLLSGISIWLNAQKKKKTSLALFLFTRGLWLIFLEFTVIRFSFFYNWYYDFTILQVIWAIGASMVCMAGLIFLSRRSLLVLAALLIAFLNLLPLLGGKVSLGLVLDSLLFNSNFLTLSPNHSIVVGYPILPWLVIMMFGYCMAPWFSSEISAQLRVRYLWLTGITLTFIFIVLRFANIYGDPSPWKSFDSFTFTIMSFLNTTKYPPSLLFACMTLGPMIMLLAFIEQWKIRSRIFETFGRVPLFYYILHFYILHLLALLDYIRISGKSLQEIDFHASASFGGIPTSYGYSLWGVYGVWIAVVVMLYPLCRWYSKYKSLHPTQKWLSYL